MSNGYAKTEGAFMELTTRVSSRVSRAPSPCRERLTRLTSESQQRETWVIEREISSQANRETNSRSWESRLFLENFLPFLAFPCALSPHAFARTRDSFFFFSVCVIEDGISHCSADRCQDKTNVHFIRLLVVEKIREARKIFF